MGLSEIKNYDQLFAQLPIELQYLAKQAQLKEVIEYILRQIELAQANGHTLSFEDFILKKQGYGAIDHHHNHLHGEDEDENTRREINWGLICATTMTLIAKYFGWTENLTATAIEDPDFDQALAIQILGLKSYQEALDFFTENAPLLYAEEFAIFTNQVDRAYFDQAWETERQSYTAQIIMSHPDDIPVIVVQYASSTLPIKHGQWNYFMRKIVEQALSQAGLAEHLATGVVTLTIHGENITHGDLTENVAYEEDPNNPGKNKVTYLNIQGQYEAWQTVRPDRIVVGILADNDAAWYEQYPILQAATEKYEMLANWLEQHYQLDICRNQLTAVTKPLVASDKPHRQDLVMDLLHAIKGEQLDITRSGDPISQMNRATPSLAWKSRVSEFDQTAQTIVNSYEVFKGKNVLVMENRDGITDQEPNVVMKTKNHREKEFAYIIELAKKTSAKQIQDEFIDPLLISLWRLNDQIPTSKTLALFQKNQIQQLTKLLEILDQIQLNQIQKEYEAFLSELQFYQEDKIEKHWRKRREGWTKIKANPRRNNYTFEEAEALNEIHSQRLQWFQQQFDSSNIDYE